MRAVNLIPSEMRSGGRRPGRSGVGAYAVLGALGLVLAMVTAYTLASRTVSDKRAEVASVERQAAVAESRTTKNQNYTAFQQLSAQRTETVASLAASRFDWAHALAEVARVLPHNAWLSSIRATVTPSVSVDGTPDPLRQSLSLPAIELNGCTTSQKNVAGLVADLRRADGVKRVSLSSAKKSEVAASGTNSTADAATDGSSGDCTQGNGERPKFSLTLFYDAPVVAASATATGSTTATTTTGTATTGGSTAPAATTTGG